jgi:monothiol glutaredoxin
MTDTNSRIDEIVRSKDVVLFMKGTALFPQCGFSSRAVAILDHLGVQFDTVDVLQDPEVRQGIKAYSDWPTIPQLYVKGEFVGELQQLLDEKQVAKAE